MAVKRTKKALDLREACVEEALRLIGQKGIESLSLREVARRLGVSHQAPYKHFPSRDHILAEVVRRAYADFGAWLDRRPLTGNPWDDLHSMGIAYLEYAHKHRLHYRLMFDTALPDAKDHPEMMREARHAFSLLRDAIAKIPGHAAQAEMEAMFVWSAIHGLASLQQSAALNTLGMSKEQLAGMVPFAMEKVGIALVHSVPKDL